MASFLQKVITDSKVPRAVGPLRMALSASLDSQTGSETLNDESEITVEPHLDEPHTVLTNTENVADTAQPDENKSASLNSSLSAPFPEQVLSSADSAQPRQAEHFENDVDKLLHTGFSERTVINPEPPPISDQTSTSDIPASPEAHSSIGCVSIGKTWPLPDSQNPRRQREPDLKPDKADFGPLLSPPKDVNGCVQEDVKNHDLSHWSEPVETRSKPVMTESTTAAEVSRPGIEVIRKAVGEQVLEDDHIAKPEGQSKGIDSHALPFSETENLMADLLKLSERSVQDPNPRSQSTPDVYIGQVDIYVEASSKPPTPPLSDTQNNHRPLNLSATYLRRL